MTEELHVLCIHISKQPCMQTKYHAQVQLLYQMTNNIQHWSTTWSLPQVIACTLTLLRYIKMSSNFQIRDEIQEKNPAHISLHQFTSAQSGLIPLNTFKSIIHLQTNTSVFLTTIQGLGNLNWFSFSLKAPQIFFTWSQNFSQLVHCVCPKCYMSNVLQPRSGYVPNILHCWF